MKNTAEELITLDKLLDNSHTRVWLDEGCYTVPPVRLYGMRVSVETIIIKSRSAVIVLRERLTKFPGDESLILGNFETGHTIHVTHCEVGRPDNFLNNEPIFTMNNCEIVTTFVDHPVAMESVEQQVVEAILVAESWDYTWRKK
ncbi:hypothetical protein KA005_38140 [bacterium]|nr:hypothetical protein [bacterium]